MKNINSLCIRFNLLKNKDKSAWDILHDLDKKKWKSYSNAVILAVTDFFDRQIKTESDPYFETREREERFVGEIVDDRACPAIYYDLLTAYRAYRWGPQKSATGR